MGAHGRFKFILKEKKADENKIDVIYEPYENFLVSILTKVNYLVIEYLRIPTLVSEHSYFHRKLKKCQNNHTNNK